ncbi:Glutathione import ATP-binding protein GsiA [Leucobacter aridicollis]
MPRKFGTNAGRIEAAALVRGDMITCERLSVGAAGAERPVLRNLSTRIEHGRVRAIVGGKGSGKTVLGWALRGALCPGLSRTAGSVNVGGFDPLDRAAAAETSAHVAWLGEDPEAELGGASTVRDALASAIAARFPGASFDDLTLHAALARLGMNDPRVLDREPRQLSPGLRRRVALAQALVRPVSAGAPKLVVLDEPLAGLDRATAAEVIGALAGMRRAIRTTVVVLTRDLELAQRFADEISVLEDGQVVETFRPEGAIARAVAAPPAQASARPAVRSQDATRPSGTGTPAPGSRQTVPGAHGVRGRAVMQAGALLGSPALELRGLSVALPAGPGATAPLSLTLGRGDSLAVTGPSGSGKSMLALAIVGGLSPSAALRIGGELLLGGVAQEARAAARTSDQRRAIQLVAYSSDRATAETHTVRTQLRRAIRRARPAVSSSAVGTRVSTLLQLADLSPAILLERVCDLSRAEQLRLALARALAHDPSVLVLDGGVAGGDAEFFEACARARRNDGVALLVFARSAAGLGASCDAELQLGDDRVRAVAAPQGVAPEQGRRAA